MFSPLLLSLGLLFQEPSTQTVEDALAAIHELNEAGAEDFDIGRALMNLAAMDDPLASEALAELVDELEGQMRHSAIMALGTSPCANRESLLGKIVSKSKHMPDRIAAASVLVKSDEGVAWMTKRYSKLKDAPVKAILIRNLKRGKDQDKLLLKAIKEKNAIVRGQALRTCATLGLDKARKTALKCLKDSNLDIRRNAAIACGTYGGEDAFKSLAELALEARGPELRAGLRRGMKLAKSPDEVGVLSRTMDKARKKDGRALLAQALIVAGAHQPMIAGPAFAKLLEDKDPGLRLLALRGIEATRHESVLPMIIELLDHEDYLIRGDAVRALSTFENVPQEHGQKIESLSRDENAAVRLSATMALKVLPEEQCLNALSHRLEDEAWAVRDVAVETLNGMRSIPATRILANHMKRAKGLVRDETYQYLKNLTGQDFGPAAESWSNWLKDRPDDFELPTPEQAEAMLKELAATRSMHEAGYGSVEYHGIAVRPGGVIFVLDLSGSMGFNYTPNAQLFHDYFTDELAKTIERLHGEHFFDIVTFNNGAKVWKGELVQATDSIKKGAVDYVKKMKPFSGTNLAAALELAFRQEEVQQIYLMTDGDPTVGVTLKSAIVDRIVELNRHRRIRVHTIIAGDVDGNFLGELALLNGGTSVDLRKGFEEEYQEDEEELESEE